MSQDFSGTHFRNGDLIPYIEGEEEWIRVGENKQPAWCYYNNDPANGPKYGKLYNWYAVADSRGLCPVGWHVPIDSEWSELKFSLIGKFCDEECVGVRLKRDFGWYNNGNGQVVYETVLDFLTSKVKGVIGGLFQNMVNLNLILLMKFVKC
jgi:uncharacterized protein (TIGR02145 family)